MLSEFWQTTNQRLVFAIFGPYKTLIYFSKYSNFIRQTLILEDYRQLRRVKLLNLLNYIKAIHFLFLSFYPLTDFERVLHFDGAYFMIPKAKFNLFYAAIQVIVIIYSNEVLFLKPTIYRLNEFLNRLVFHSDSSFFVWPKYKNEIICQRIQRRFIEYLNLFQSCLLIMGKLLN